ncbi:hypothetical protein MauCBS54593_005596 [Microsporum audouinii]
MLKELVARAENDLDNLYVYLDVMVEKGIVVIYWTQKSRMPAASTPYRSPLSLPQPLRPVAPTHHRDYEEFALHRNTRRYHERAYFTLKPIEMNKMKGGSPFVSTSFLM